MSPEQFAREHEVPVARVRAALAYAEAFAEEIQRDLEEEQANARWVESQDAAWRSGHPGGNGRKAVPKSRR